MQECLEVCGGQGPNPEYGKKFISRSIYYKVNKKNKNATKTSKRHYSVPHSITLMSWSTVLRGNVYEIRKRGLLRLTLLRLNFELCAKIQIYRFLARDHIWRTSALVRFGTDLHFPVWLSSLLIKLVCLFAYLQSYATSIATNHKLIYIVLQVWVQGLISQE